jgi:uncharacterized membrane protein YtjA (UPF0391 family)
LVDWHIKYDDTPAAIHDPRLSLIRKTFLTGATELRRAVQESTISRSISDDADTAMRLNRQASLSCTLYNSPRKVVLGKPPVAVEITTVVKQKYPDGTWEIDMLYYAVVFLVIALIAGALGFFGIAGAAVGIAKILFFVFLVLFVVSLLLGRRAGPTV